MANNNFNNAELEAAAKRMRHSREMQARAYEQQSRASNNVDMEGLAPCMNHSRAMQDQAYDQLGRDSSQP